MKIGILTNEYPPNVYGGAGVSVEYLTDEADRARVRRVACALLAQPPENLAAVRNAWALEVGA